VAGAHAAPSQDDTRFHALYGYWPWEVKEHLFVNMQSTFDKLIAQAFGVPPESFVMRPGNEPLSGWTTTDDDGSDEGTYIVPDWMKEPVYTAEDLNRKWTERGKPIQGTYRVVEEQTALVALCAHCQEGKHCGYCACCP